LTFVINFKKEEHETKVMDTKKRISFEKRNDFKSCIKHRDEVF